MPIFIGIYLYINKIRFIGQTNGGGEMMDKLYHGRDILKRQIAEELGYGGKIKKQGWGELSSIEAGRIGGLVSGYMKKHNW